MHHLPKTLSRTTVKCWTRSQSVVTWGRQHPDDFAALFRQEWFYQNDVLKERLKAEAFCWADISLSDLTLSHIAQTLTHPTPGATSMLPVEFASTSENQKKQYFLAKRDRWSIDQRKTFVGICGGFMKEMGYEIPWEVEI